MIEFLFVEDMLTGETLQIVRQPPAKEYLVIRDSLESEIVKKASIRKVIRTWMKGV